MCILGDPGEESRFRRSLSALPPSECARINSELPGEYLLGEAKGLAMADDLEGQSVPLGQRVESQEFDHFTHVIVSGRGVSLLPIDDRHLVAADYFGHVDLAELEVKAALADFLAQGFWSGRVALFLDRVGPPWTTHPS